MGFEDDLREESRNRSLECNVAKVRADLPKTDQKALDAALANMSNSDAALLRAIQKQKSAHRVGKDSLKKHRMKRCSCYSESA